MGSGHEHFALGAAVAGAALVAIVFSLIEGAPKSLPGAALGSELLLYTERAVAIFVAILVVIVVVARAWEGKLPDELSARGFKYSDLGAAKDETEKAIDALTDEAEQARAERTDLGKRLAELEGMTMGLRLKFDALEPDDAEE